MRHIKIKNLHKKYKVKEKTSFLKDLFRPKYRIINAVDDISFSIDKGELIGFIGPNGAGKTTTIKMLCGILWPTTGEIDVDGMTPHKDRKKYVKNIGAVFGQRKSLWPELSVRDNLELIGSMYGLNKNLVDKRIKELSKMIDLGEFYNQPFRKLSLGQQMKAELVSSLIHSPKILFLDEPTIGMDIIAKSDFIQLLKEINNKEKCTIILTSHDLLEIEKLCRRIIVINRGHVLFDGDVEKIRPDTVIVRYKEGLKLKEKHVKKNCLKAFLQKIDVSDISIKEISLEEMIKKHYV